MTPGGPLLILSGPSGSGKSTVVQHLVRMSDMPLRLSVSATTRPKRLQEVNGVHYWFLKAEDFEAELARNGFLEWAKVYDNYYGTLKREVERHWRDGMGVILEIDVQGAAQVRQLYPGCLSIFLCPSSMVELERRLRGRGTETEEVLQRRLTAAGKELERVGEYTHWVYNDDLEATIERLRGLIRPLFSRNTDA